MTPAHRFVGTVIAALAFALSACGPVTPTQPAPDRATQWHALTSAEVQAVQDGVRSRLKDPLSAQFSDFISAGGTQGGVIYVCGKVNAKNSFGGYTGFQRFYGILSPEIKLKGTTKSLPPMFTPISMGGSEIDTRVTLDMCLRNLPQRSQ